MTSYWICLRWRTATIGPPECPCCQDHVQMDPYCDSERRVWWQLRMQQKPRDVQDAVGLAGWGLRDHDWPRIVSALDDASRARSTGFYVYTLELEPTCDEPELPLYAAAGQPW